MILGCRLTIYSVSTQKTKPATFSIASPKLNALIFCTNCLIKLGDNCEFAYYYVFHLTCVMLIPGKTFQTSYMLTTNETVKQ